MKVWASTSAIGLSLAYLSTGCSSEPPNGNNYMPTAGNPGGGGTPGAAGTPGGGGAGTMAGSATAGATTGGTGTAGTPAGGSAGESVGGGGAGGGTGTPGTCPQGVMGHCKMGETYPTYPGYTLTLVEDFEEPLDLNNDPIWTWSDGSPADGQTEFEESQIGFENGYMTITADSPCAAKTTNAACIPGGRMSYAEALAPNPTANVGDMGVKSGELRTKYNNFRYGRYEVKYKAPIANPGSETVDGGMAGNFLSTMFIFRNPKNTVWNEIDIELEPWHPTHIAGNMVNAAGRSGYPGDKASAWDVTGPANFYIHEEHVYAFNWTPTMVTWEVDGEVIHSDSGGGNAAIPTLSAKIMMNLWVFSGSTFGDGVNNKFPFTAYYDWFRFYKLDTETTYPCSPTPSCLPADDKTASAQNNPKETNYGQ